MSANIVLEARNVARTYSVSRGAFSQRRLLRAVDGISLTVEEGAVLGIVGESGCGKTTLAKLLLGLETPTGGEILMKGQPTARLDRLSMSRFVQPIFQDPYLSLNPRKTIGSIIALPLRVQGAARGGALRRRVCEIMEMTGLPRRLIGAYPSQLSGGQRQRVAIARALVGEPRVVVCDEPTSALDVSIQAQILNLLQDLRQQLGLTYVLISHNLAVVQHIATAVAVMYFGRIVEYGPTDEIFARPSHPYTRALLASVLSPEPGLGVPETHLGTTMASTLIPPSGCSFHPRCVEARPCCAEKPPPAYSVGACDVACHLYAPPTPVRAA